MHETRTPSSNEKICWLAQRSAWLARYLCAGLRRGHSNISPIVLNDAQRVDQEQQELTPCNNSKSEACKVSNEAPSILTADDTLLEIHRMTNTTGNQTERSAETRATYSGRTDREHHARDLLGDRKEATIIHAGERYRLRITANNKLILTK